MTRNKRKTRLSYILLGLTCILVVSACQSQTTSIPVSTTISVPTEAASTSEIIPSPTQSPSPTPALSPSATPTLTSVSPLIPLAGIELHKLNNSDGLDLIKQTEVHWLRRNGLLWSDVEPTEGARDWDSVSSLEKELINASDKNLEVILIIRDTPLWAQQIPGISCGPIAQENLTAFTSFMYDVVSRFSVAPYNVKYWELGNEPDVSFSLVEPNNQFGCWGNVEDSYYGGSYYAEMLKVVYPQIKAADPESQVIVGGLLMDCDPINPPETSVGSGQYKDCTSSKFLEGILQNGGGDFFDGVSFHAYDYYYGSLGQYGNTNWHSDWSTTGPVLSTKVNYLRTLLGIFGYTDKFLMNTEMALLCGRGQDPHCKTDEYENTKAYFIAQSYAIALSEDLDANVWYSLTGWRGSGLANRKLETYPAFNSFRFSTTILKEARYSDEIVNFPGVKGYEFIRNNKLTWILWSQDGDEHNIHLNNPPMAIYDVYGESIPVTQDIPIYLSPVYIEW